MSAEDGKLNEISDERGQGDGEAPVPLSGTQAGRAVLGDLLQAILGGGVQSLATPGADRAESDSEARSGSGLGGILSAVLEQLASEQNLPPEAAQSVVTFVVEKLFASRLRRAVGGVSGTGDQGQAQPAAFEMELDGLLERAGTAEGVSQDDLRATTLPQELAAKSGLDLDTVIKALEMVMNVLAGKEIKPSPRPSAKKKAKKSTAKKTTAKKPTAKKSTAKKTSAKKPTAKKSTAKKTAAKKAAAKKSTAKKPAAKKSTAKKTTAKKPAAKKSTAKKTTAKKTTAKSSSKAAAKFETKI